MARPLYSLTFVDDKRLAATFVTRRAASESPPGLSKSDDTQNFPMRLHAVFLGADAGNVVHLGSWPCDSRGARILAAHDGEFVAATGGRIILYDRDLQPVRSVRLPRPPPSPEQMYASPDGRSILVLSGGQNPVRWTWIGTDQLETRGSWSLDETGSAAVSRTAVAAIVCGFLSHCRPSVVAVRGLTTGWSRVAAAAADSELQFVADELLFVSGDPERTINIRSGEQAALESPGRHTGAAQYDPKAESDSCGFGSKAAVASAGERRFVIPVCRVEGAHPALDIGGHTVLKKLYVFDIPSPRPAYVLKVAGPKIKDDMHFALSPDGRRLAVLSHLRVEVFELPPVR